MSMFVIMQTIYVNDFVQCRLQQFYTNKDFFRAAQIVIC